MVEKVSIEAAFTNIATKRVHIFDLRRYKWCNPPPILLLPFTIIKKKGGPSTRLGSEQHLTWLAKTNIVHSVGFQQLLILPISRVLML